MDTQTWKTRCFTLLIHKPPYLRTRTIQQCHRLTDDSSVNRHVPSQRRLHGVHPLTAVVEWTATTVPPSHLVKKVVVKVLDRMVDDVVI